MEYVSLTALIQGLGPFPSYSIFCCSREEKERTFLISFFVRFMDENSFPGFPLRPTTLHLKSKQQLFISHVVNGKNHVAKKLKIVQKIGQRSSAFLLIEVAQERLFSGLSVLLPDHSSDTESKSSNSFFRLLVKSNWTEIMLKYFWNVTENSLNW